LPLPYHARYQANVGDPHEHGFVRTGSHRGWNSISCGTSLQASGLWSGIPALPAGMARRAARRLAALPLARQVAEVAAANQMQRWDEETFPARYRTWRHEHPLWSDLLPEDAASCRPSLTPTVPSDTPGGGRIGPRSSAELTIAGDGARPG
jgi:hypothetical protein